MPAPLKLNLGCGFDHRSGYVNVDVDPKVKPDKIHDLYKPLPYTDATVDEVLMQDVLEHFTREDAYVLLRECSRILKTGGKLVVRVPNVAAIYDKYRNQPDLLMLFLYGDTSFSGVWGAHKYGYTPKILHRIATQLELHIEQWQLRDTNFVFELRKVPKKNSSITILGTGWHPTKKQLRTVAQGETVVATNVTSLLKAIIQDKASTRIWCIDTQPHPLIAKLLVRPLLRQIDYIFVSTIENESFVKDLLKFSHLRIVRATNS